MELNTCTVLKADGRIQVRYLFLLLFFFPLTKLG
jgi:hypothetical protein